MGLNVNLTTMLGILPKVSCPNCQSLTETMFEDYDIECGDPNPSPGIWVFNIHCDNCDHEFELKFQVKAKVI